jgi:hypothetical protein
MKYKIKMIFEKEVEFQKEPDETKEKALQKVEEWIYDEWHNEVGDARRQLIVMEIEK